MWKYSNDYILNRLWKLRVYKYYIYCMWEQFTSDVMQDIVDHLLIGLLQNSQLLN